MKEDLTTAILEDQRKEEEARRKLPRPEAPLLRDLASIGVQLEYIWSTSHIKTMPLAAFRIMLEHLSDDSYTDRTKEGIARALGRRDARDSIWSDVIELYRQRPDDYIPPREMGLDLVSRSGQVKDGLACSISVMARPADLATIIELISDRRNGPSRIFFIRNLSRLKHPNALATLVRLRDDPDLKTEIEFRIRSKLRRMKSDFRMKS